MTREQLEHVIRAAARIADATEIVVVGSQALLGEFPAAPAELLESMEADVYPRDHPERADLIDGAIGELSPFHETHGYYASAQPGRATRRRPAERRGGRPRLPPDRSLVGLRRELTRKVPAER